MVWVVKTDIIFCPTFLRSVTFFVCPFMSSVAEISASGKPTDGRQLTGVQREHHNILAPPLRGGGGEDGWVDLGGYLFHAGIGSTHHFPEEKKDQKCPASFLPFPLPVSHTAISKSCFGYFGGPVEDEIREPWRRKLRNYIDDYCTVYKFVPGFYVPVYDYCSANKELYSVYHTSIIRVSLQPVDRDYI